MCFFFFFEYAVERNDDCSFVDIDAVDAQPYDCVSARESHQQPTISTHFMHPCGDSSKSEHVKSAEESNRLQRFDAVEF